MTTFCNAFFEYYLSTHLVECKQGTIFCSERERERGREGEGEGEGEGERGRERERERERRGGRARERLRKARFCIVILSAL
jgi:hypothetical protein